VSDRRTLAIADRLATFVAPAVTARYEFLDGETLVTDGWAQRGDGRGGSGTSSTEGAAVSAGQIELERGRIRTALGAIEAAVDVLARLVIGRADQYAPAAADALRCREGQLGKDASLWSDDLRCPALGNEGRGGKMGLCVRHYAQYYRWRKARGLAVDKDFEDARK
jgi:hypothetical protein